MEQVNDILRLAVERVQQWSSWPYFYHAVAILLGLVVLFWLYLRWQRRHRGIEPFRSQGGRIEIAPQTVRSIIQYAAKGVKGVEQAHCRLIPGRRLRVDISIHLIASAHLREVDSEIKRRIRAALKQQFGMENVDPINIRVKKLVGDPVIEGNDSDARNASAIESYEEEAFGNDQSDDQDRR